MDTEDLHKNMRREMEDGGLFARAAEMGREYLRGVPARRVSPGADAEAALAAFREPLPETPGGADEILEMLHRIGSPATMAQTGGRFFGLVNGGAVPAALAARMLADMWDQNAVLRAASPVNAVLEETCEAWLKDLFGLPDETVAGFVSGSSMAIFCALAAARWRLCEREGYDVNARGMAGAPKLRVITGRHAHSTVVKAVALLGFGDGNIEWAEVDGEGRIRPETLPEMDARTILVLQAGNVNSGAFDPLRVCCERARGAGAWVHIDGAFGLWARAAPALAHLADGAELAHSWSTDGHKTLNTPYECGVCLCADKDALMNAMRNSGAYIMYSEHREGMLYTAEMSRRARAADLWAALKYLGRAGTGQMVTTLHEHTRRFAAGLRAEGFNIINDVVFNQALAAYGGADETAALVKHIQDSGEAWVGASEWFGKPVVRVSVCSWATTEEDVDRGVRAFADARRAVESAGA